MKIKSLALRNFRSYEELNLELSPGINLLVGENAQGKTNILESVFYTALARSHRTSDDKDMVKQGKKEALSAILNHQVGFRHSMTVSAENIYITVHTLSDGSCLQKMPIIGI